MQESVRTSEARRLVHKAISLREDAKALFQAAESLSPGITRKGNPLKVRIRKVPPAGTLKMTMRQLQVYSYLRKHGTKTRGELLVETGIPKGTMGKILATDFFEKAPDGRWAHKEELAKK